MLSTRLYQLEDKQPSTKNTQFSKIVKLFSFSDLHECHIMVSYDVLDHFDVPQSDPKQPLQQVHTDVQVTEATSHG